MLELADETDSKSVASNGVWVQVPLSAPNLIACTFWYGRFLFSMGDAPWNSMPVRRGTCPTAGKQIEKKPMLHNVTQVCFRTSKEILGVPRGIRTPDLLVRSQSLYPAELWAHFLLRTVVLTTIAIISHLLQLVKRFFEFFSGFSKKVCITRNFGVFCLREWQKGQTQCICCRAKTDLTNRKKSRIIKVKRAHQ